jgi:hypothetical protein
MSSFDRSIRGFCQDLVRVSAAEPRLAFHFARIALKQREAAARRRSSASRSPLPAITSTSDGHRPARLAVASMRNSNPFFRTRRPAVNSSGSLGPIPSWRRQRTRLSGSGLNRVASTPYGIVSLDSADAPRAMARSRRLSLHAVTQPALANVRPAAQRAARCRSATNTSDPWRLTTSGKCPAAAAAMAPPGTTQWPCTSVACARRITDRAFIHAPASASGATAYATPRSRTSAFSAPA